MLEPCIWKMFDVCLKYVPQVYEKYTTMCIEMSKQVLKKEKGIKIKNGWRNTDKPKKHREAVHAWVCLRQAHLRLLRRVQANRYFMFDDSPSQICLVVLKNCRLTGPLATFQFERNASYGSSSFVMCAFLVFYSTMVVGAKDQSILTDFACLRRFHIIVSMPTCGYMC